MVGSAASRDNLEPGINMHSAADPRAIVLSV
jgi:hypothetical protein